MKELGSSPEKELLLYLTPARESREELNNCGLDNFEVQFDLCDKACISERKLKVHTAKWHTKVAPLYENTTRQLDFREKFNAECLIWVSFLRTGIGPELCPFKIKFVNLL